MMTLARICLTGKTIAGSNEDVLKKIKKRHGFFALPLNHERNPVRGSGLCRRGKQYGEFFMGALPGDGRAYGAEMSRRAGHSFGSAPQRLVAMESEVTAAV